MVKIGAAIFIAALATSAWASACFDDKNLQTLDFQHEQGALLYVWSPRMLLSAQHAASALRQAQQHGLRFVPLHDASVPQSELDGARQRLLGPVLNGFTGAKGANLAAPAQSMPPRADNAYSANALANSQPLCSTRLIERDALRHFPTAFVLQPSGVHRYPIVGAMPEAAWASSIAQRLKTAVAPRAVSSANAMVDPAIEAMAAPSVKVLGPERGVRDDVRR
jgi:hypothetical protein